MIMDTSNDYVNDTFRGFGFAEAAMACEMKEQVRKVIEPFGIQEYDMNRENGLGNSFSHKRISAVRASKLESNLSKGSSRISAQPLKEERASSASSLEIVAFSQTTKTSKWKLSWKRLTNIPYLRHWNTITEAFRWQEHEMEIGYPTDVKHVAHIGWDGPSVPEMSLIEELKPSSGSAAGSIKQDAEPTSANQIQDSELAAQCTCPASLNSGVGNISGMPAPPTQFMDIFMPQPQKKHSWWNITYLLRKSMNSACDKEQAHPTCST